MREFFHRPGRRAVIGGLAAGTSLLVLPRGLRAADTAGTVKLGFITPQTGSMGLFGEPDAWVVEKMKTVFADGIQNGGKTYAVEILLRDAQSDSNKAAELAGQLILDEGCHLLLAPSTSDTVAPTLDQAELYQTPALTCGAPWQQVILPRGGADKPFEWGYHFFWGLDDILKTFVGMWNSVETNRKVGMLFPQTADGEVWGNADYGLAKPTKEAGFEVVMPGFFQPRSNDFSAIISAFKEAGVEIVGGIAYADDLKTFLTQANQQGFRPKVITVAAGLLFPSGVAAMGELGDGLSTEVWWTPAYPFKSTLTGQTSRELADQWEAETGKQWTQPLGYSHAVFEVAADILKRATDPLDKTAIRDAMKATVMMTLIGPVNFTTGPHPNVSTTAIFGGQWVKGAKFPFDLKIVANPVSDLIKPEQPLELLGG